jgi:putative membrane protein
MMYDYYGYGDNFYPMHSAFGGIFMILTWVLIIWGIVSLVKHFSHHSHDGNNHAIDILKERYAKGEITKEQYESMKKDLR